MHKLVTRLALLLGVSAAFLPAAAARAQKALVYCPVGIDIAGCDNAVAALKGDYPDGVDRLYDGTSGTVDAKTVDLWDYAVLVVPSLADGSDKAPYALLRDPVVSERLHDAVMGRVALWSGTPDLGSTNRALKDGLLRSLAKWAAGNYGTVKGPGLVALQDLSDAVSSRYGWVKGLTGIGVVADSALNSYSSVRAMTATGATILADGNGGVIAYTNMASLGFQLPQGAAGVTMDAVGQTGTTQGGQVVLITSPGGNTGKAVVRTDKDDYAPGTTVTITGTGFQPGETVNMVLHEDPEIHDNRTLTSVADGNGGFVNTSFSPEAHDIGVRFILTATGAASGVRAEATFTDAIQINTVTVGAQSPSPVTPGSSAAYTVVVNYNGNTNKADCTVNVSVGTLPTGVSVGSLSPATITIPKGSSASTNVALTLNTTAQTAANGTGYAFAVSATMQDDAINGCTGSTVTGNGTLTVAAPAVVATSLSVGAPSPASVSYGSTGPVSLSATLTRTTGGAAVSGASVAFTVDGASVGSATTNASGVATLSTYNPSALSAGSHTVQASSAQQTLGGTTYAASTSGTSTLTVGQVTPVVTWATPADIPYGTALSGTQLNATASVPGTFLYTPAAGTVLDAGTGQTLSVLFTPTDVTNYTTATKTVTINVLKGTPVITWNNPAPITYPTPLGATQLNATASVPGTFAYTPASGTVLSAGTGQTLSVTFTPTNTTNYGSATKTVTIDVGRGSQTITFAALASKTYGDAPFAVSATTSSGLDVSFAAAGACTVAPPTLGGSPWMVTITAAGSCTVTARQTGDGNYNAATDVAQAFSIAQKSVSVGSVTVANKVYDGTTAATITARALAGGSVVNSDDVALAGGTAAFSDKNVGAGKTVSVTGLTLTGAAAGNYALASGSATTTADITARSVTPSITADDKEYDGTTAATVHGSLSGAVAGDALTLGVGAASFSDKNVGTNKTVTATGLTLGGADAGNYLLSATTATATAKITARALTGTITASDKVYDGTTAATAAAHLGAGVVSGDNVTLAAGSATFADKNVGTGKTVTASLSLGGTDAGNYTVNATATTTASITPLGLTGSFTAQNKIYDGTTAATVSGNPLAGVLGGDAVSLVVGTAAFADKNVGTHKAVTAALSLSGAAAGNYTVNATATAYADVTARALAVTATGVNKVYDGTTAATVTLGDDRVAGDVLTASYSAAAFADKNVGTGKTVSVSGISISGADAGNYVANTTASTTASITARSLTASATAQNKVYDATTAATVTLSTDKLAADVVTTSFTSATFSDRNVGTGKTVTVSGIAISGGADAGNYLLAATTATTTASITALGITGSVTAADKVYDGTTSATITGRSLAGVLGTDAVTLVGGTATFADRNVGAGKTVTATGLALDGAAAGNYTVNATATTTANITQKSVTGSFTAADKVYDGTTAATITTRQLAGTISGDAVSLAGGSAAFDTKDVGAGKTVTGTGFTLSGGDAPNYLLASATLTTTAAVTPKALEIKADDKTMNFGDATRPPFTATPIGLVGGETVAVLGGTLQFGGTATAVTSTSPAGTYTIIPSGLTSSNYAPITFTNGTLTVVDKTAPVASNSLATPNPVQINTTGVTVTATITDVGYGSSNIASAFYTMDGGAPVAMTLSGTAPTVTVTGAIPAFSAAGVHNVCVQGKDAAGNTSKADCVLLAVFDPNGGFVTGGGWVNSPAGAYTANPTLSGKATFGFVSKYVKGQTLPTGNTQFQFHAAGFDFKSTSYDWLVISGARAQYKGSGSINGSGDYGFILTAVDGQTNGGGGTDYFRIKVYDKTTSAIIYDNMAGATDDATPGPSNSGTLLGGGSIQIQSK